MEKKNELVTTENNTFAITGSFQESLGEEMQGLNLTFDRIKVPSGGGLIYEIPSDNPDEPTLAKDFKAVILCHNPVQAYYKEKYTGANESPDCSSTDSIVGIDKVTGEVKSCKECELNKFGSGENNSKACKAKRRIFVLLEGNVIPIVFSLPTSSLNDFSKYIMRLMGKGKKSYQVVTKFSLKRDTNQGGIAYSKVVLSTERDLTPAELTNIQPYAEQVKALSLQVKTVEVGNDE